MFRLLDTANWPSVGVPQCEIAPFVSEQGELYELDMRSIARVLSFIQALHLRDPPGVALSPRKGFPEDEWHWSMDPNVQSLNLEKKAFDPLHRDSDQKPVVVHKFVRPPLALSFPRPNRSAGIQREMDTVPDGRRPRLLLQQRNAGDALEMPGAIRLIGHVRSPIKR